MKRVRRRDFLIATGLLGAPFVHAQQPRIVRKIGFLDPGIPGTSRANWARKQIPKSLQKHGFEEGKSLAIEFRFAEGRRERLAPLVNELVRQKVELIVTLDNDAALAAKQVTRTIPVVMAVSALPAEFGLIDTYARPGGNITGFDWYQTPEIFAKRYQILKSAVPHAKRAAALRHPSSNERHEHDLWGDKFLRMIGSTTGLAVEHVTVMRPEDFATALDRIEAIAPDVLVVTLDKTYDREVAAFTIKNRLVSIGGPGYSNVDVGGLLTHGVDTATMTERIASCIAKILQGTKPRDLPVEFATKYELVLNMRTARAMGVKFSSAFMAQVDRMIE